MLQKHYKFQRKNEKTKTTIEKKIEKKKIK